MASKRESHPDQEEEAKTPIFTVLKMIENFPEIANFWRVDSLFSISFPVKSVDSSMPEEAVLEIADKESQTKQSLVAGCSEMKTCVEATGKNSTFGNTWSRRGKAATSMASKRESQPDQEEGKIPIFTGQKIVEIFQDIANCCCLGSLFPISSPVESVNSSMPEEAVLEIAGKESQTPQSLVAGCSEMKTCVEATEKNSTFGNIWSSGGKAATSAPQIQTIKSIIKSAAGADIEVDICNKKDLVNNKSISRDISSVLDGEEEIFTPDKENFSPNTLQMRVLKNEESRRSHNSKANCAPSIHPDESMSPTSNKENQTPKVALEKPARRPFGSWTKLEQKRGTMALKNRVERVPFKSLLMKSGGKSRWEMVKGVSGGKSRWEMVKGV